MKEGRKERKTERKKEKKKERRKKNKRHKKCREKKDRGPFNMLCFGSVLFVAPTPSMANICQSEEAFALSVLIIKNGSVVNGNLRPYLTSGQWGGGGGAGGHLPF